MQTETKSKLTLWVDGQTKNFGKKWAREHHSSLSGLVTHFLLRLQAMEKNPETPTPLVKSLSGVLKDKRLGREDYRHHLRKKYLGA